MDALTRFQTLLRDLFQLDTADLDFGIYRLFHLKREEMEGFITEQLPRMVDESFRSASAEEQAQAERELEDLGRHIREEFDDPDAITLVGEVQNKYRNPVGRSARELLERYDRQRQKVQQAQLSEAQRADVFNHLYAFFSRYYDEGDFVPRHYYGAPEAYAVPYNGEEVYFHWANRDQHYAKTGERFKDYVFSVDFMGASYRVRFVVAQATTAPDNTKGDARFFSPLVGSMTYDANSRTLTLPFEYRLPTEEELATFGNGGKGQEGILGAAEEPVLAAIPEHTLALALSEPVHVTESESLTLLMRRLRHFARKQTSDYFVHRDLKGFLTGELEFYLKDQILALGDVQGNAESKLRILGVTRRLGHHIIAFLDQVEAVQRRLFEKSKFVTEVRYCITIGTISGAFYDEIAANDAQWAEWKMLGLCEDGPERVGANPGDGRLAFLRAHPTLVLDTKHFSQAFVDRLLASYDDLDDMTDGVLIQGDNYQALNLLRHRYARVVRCVYIDPPYNRPGDNSFPYKDGYRHSSWLAMMRDRLAVARSLMQQDGAIFVSIDENERTHLEQLLRAVWGTTNRVEELVWAQNTTHSQSPLYSTNHEYIEVFARDRTAAERRPTMFREPKPGYVEIMALAQQLNATYPAIAEVEREIRALMRQHLEDYKKELQAMGLVYNRETKKQDPWRGVYNYRHAEYRDAAGRYVPEAEARARGARIWVWRASDPSVPAQKQAQSTRDPDDPNYRFYRPNHPVTGRPCVAPHRGWLWPYRWEDAGRDTFVKFEDEGRIVWGEDETKVPQYKRFLHEVETNVAKSVFHDYADGEKELAGLFGVTALFPSPKPTTLVERFVEQTCQPGDLVMDFFAGSGTTGHSVININRRDGGARRFILVEVENYFDTVLLPRIKKVVFSPAWKDGQPQDLQPALEGFWPDWVQRSPRLLKVMRLESYEDALHNLVTDETVAREALRAAATRTAVGADSYRLHYLARLPLDASATMLAAEKLEHPFRYELEALTDGGPAPCRVDLVETFNLLYGLHVQRIEVWHNEVTGCDYRAVVARHRDGKQVLVLWRDMEGLDPAAERAYLEERTHGFAEVLINGDCAVPGVRSLDPAFKRLMEAGGR